MKKLFLSIFAVVITLLPVRWAQAQGAFVIGVAPHTSARIILEMYQPLRLYLEKQLEMPVDVVTAPDFDTFAKRALAQEFDLVVTTGQQARLLQIDARYTPLLTYKADFKAVVLVSAQGPVKKAQDLKGGSALGLSPTSQVTLWGRHWLKDNGLGSLPLKYVSASDSVAQLLISGDASVGFTSLANFQKLSQDMQSNLRILAESKPMLGRVYLLNSRHKAVTKKIDNALWSFAETPEARQYFLSNKLAGYRKLKPKEMNSMDGFAAEVRTFLKNNSQ